MNTKPLPSYEELHERLEYLPLTGDFYWKTHNQPGLIGKNAVSKENHNYCRIVLDGQRYRAHRLAWMMYYGTDPLGIEIDHFNKNKKDNRITNLKLCTQELNSRNCGKRVANTSGFKGVSYKKAIGKYIAKTSISNEDKSRKYIHLGCFYTAEEAGQAYQKWEHQQYGHYLSPDS